MKLKDVLYLTGILAIIVLLAYILFGKQDKNPILEYVYKTDTIYVDKPYEVPIPYELSTPPKIVKIYILDSLSIDSLNVIIKDKDVVISKLKDSIRINFNYLKQFPNNPKLLSLGLTNDSLNLGLLDISGSISEYIWPIDLDNYHYLWDNSSKLTRYISQSPSTNSGPSISYYVAGGFDLLNRTPYLSNQVNISNSKILLYTTADIGLLDIKTSCLKFGIGYKLYGKNNITFWKRDNF